MIITRLFIIIFTFGVIRGVPSPKLPFFFDTINNLQIHHFRPCENFYQYACNSWISSNEKPPSEPIWNPFISATHRINNRLKELVQDFNPENPAKLFLNHCINAKEFTADLVLLLKNFGDWPLLGEDTKEFEWLKQVAKVTRLLGIHPIVKFRAGIDYKNPNKRLLYIEPGDFIFPYHYLLKPATYTTELEAYADWITNTALHLSKNTTSPNNQLRTGVKTLIRFESRLAQLIGHSKRSERIPISRLVTQIPFDWLQAIRVLLDDFQPTFTEHDTIAIKNYQYFKNLVLLIQKTPPKIVANYIMWAIIKDLSRETSPTLRFFNFAIDKAVLGVEMDSSREFECMSKTIEYFSPILVENYVRLNNPSESVKFASLLVDLIKAEMIKIVGNSDWLSKEGKELMCEKIEHIRVHLGFTPSDSMKKFLDIRMTDNHFLNVLMLKGIQKGEELSKLGLSETKNIIEWPSSPFEVNAYYSILQNAIFIPLGLLQEPFYSKEIPNIANFGALGSLIGHELSHALDPSGISADKTGKITNWLPTTDLSTYRNNTKICKNSLQNFGSLEEIIADREGFKASLAAFKNYKKGSHSLKTFFSSYAQMWCEIEGVKEIFSEDQHPMVSLRVHQTLKNDPDFQQSFDCSILNDLKVCQLW